MLTQINISSMTFIPTLHQQINNIQQESNKPVYNRLLPIWLFQWLYYPSISPFLA